MTADPSPRDGNAATGAAAGDEGVAIVTRATGTIERATALRLARCGLRVAICDAAEPGRLAALREELASGGAEALAIEADATREADVVRMVEAAARFGSIQVLVNGMAPHRCAPGLDIDAAEIAEDIGRGVRSVLLCTRAVVAHMAGGGRIVNVISSAGRYRSAYFHYAQRSGGALREAGTDGALFSLTRELAFELAPRRIRVNAAAIGWMRTPESARAWQRLSSRERSFVLEEISLGRLGEPDEAAAVVEFLATEASSYVTGTAIDVNGGWWMS